MWLNHVSSRASMKPEDIKRCFDPRDEFKTCRGMRGESGSCLSAYSIIGGNKTYLKNGQDAWKRCMAEGKGSKEDKAMGCFVGNVIGDALGAPMEFSSVRYPDEPDYDESEVLTGLDDNKMWEHRHYNNFGLKPGQWTDDASMGMCIADCLLVNGRFDPLDTRARFTAWNRFGYNNAFGRDAIRGFRSSIGLGGNISMSMWEFCQDGGPYTKAGDRETSGNGSVMRNGAVPTFFSSNIEEAMKASYKQSKTTHQGDEAAELCRLLSFVCVKFMNGSKKDLLDDLKSAGFESEFYTIRCMRDGVEEQEHPENQHLKLKDRRWTWKEPDYKYCATRSRLQPGYIGSYAMDAMGMALHCVYSTSSFKEASLKVANMCGDADSVCAVVCQMAGSLYGLSSIPPSWINTIQNYDAYTTLGKAHCLFTQTTVDAFAPSALRSAALIGKAVPSTPWFMDASGVEEEVPDPEDEDEDKEEELACVEGDVCGEIVSSGSENMLEVKDDDEAK
eukprot:TRINITY_DN300_c7_g1_i1.p1 TRINITY_DN300_c7_g1~~TRINITY_DN300_c7_g1_i1.p1  ORF type:complete len:503 (+),score=87.36 TRINITY_DN300_c7_g1_i1:83-1591(+)